MKWRRGIDQIREGQRKAEADRRRLLERLQQQRQSAEQEKSEALAAIEAKRTRFAHLDVDQALNCARRFFFLELDVAASRPEQLNRPTLELLELFLKTLRDHQTHAVLQWPVGQGDISILHPLALLSILCASPEQTTSGYAWCPAVRDFRTLYFPWRGSGTGADQRGMLIERKAFLKHNQLHVTRAWAGQAEETRELKAFHETLAHLQGLSKQDAPKPHLAHPTIAEIYPTFGALGGVDAPKPFGTVTRDLFGRVEHGAGLKKMQDHRGSITQAKTAPFALFGICPRADVSKVLAHPALTPAKGGRPPDICLVDLGAAGLRRLGHGWEDLLQAFYDTLGELHPETPVLAVTQDVFVHRRLDRLSRSSTSDDHPSRRARSAVVFRSSDSPFATDPAIGVVSPVRFQFHSAGGNGVLALRAMSEAARACSDASRAGALRFAMGDVRRTMNLPCGLNAAFDFLCESEGQAAAEAFLERRSAATAIARIRQCMECASDGAERSVMAAAEAAVRKAYEEFAVDTPIGAMLGEVAGAVARKSSRSLIIFSSETERRLGEQRFLDGSDAGELLKKRLADGFVLVTTLSDVDATLKEIEATRDRNSWKRLVVVTPSQARLSVLMGRAWLPEEVIVISDRDFVVTLARSYKSLASHPDIAGEGKIGARLAAASTAARIEGEARDVGPVDLELSARSIGDGAGMVIDLTGGGDDDGEREVVELSLESGRTLRVRPGGLMVRHNRHAEIHPFERASGREIEVGEAIVVPDDAFVQEARSVLPVRVLAQGWVDVYHAAVEAALPALPGETLLAKARYVVQEIRKKGARKYSEAAALDWLKIAEHRLAPRDELRSHAPLRWPEFNAFMQVLGQSSMAEKIWKEGIAPLRTDRRRAGVKMAQAFASVLVDPHGGSASLAPEIKTRIATLRKRALEHVDGVVASRREQPREGAVA